MNFQRFMISKFLTKQMIFPCNTNLHSRNIINHCKKSQSENYFFFLEDYCIIFKDTDI